MTTPTGSTDISRALGQLEGTLVAVVRQQQEMQRSLDLIRKEQGVALGDLRRDLDDVATRVASTEAAVQEIKPKMVEISHAKWFGKGVIYAASVASAAIASLVTAAWKYFSAQ